MRYRTLADPPPDHAEVYGKIKFHRIDKFGTTETCCVKMWRGKQQSPCEFLSFDRSPNPHGRREEWITERKESEDASQDFKAKQKREEAERLAEEVGRYKVGTLVYYSWGYDQTNIDFFQVVRRVGKRTVWIRPIAHKQGVGEATGPFSGTCRPDPGNFTGEAKKKLIGPYGLSMPHGAVSIIEDPDRDFHESWGH